MGRCLGKLCVRIEFSGVARRGVGRMWGVTAARVRVAGWDRVLLCEAGGWWESADARHLSVNTSRKETRVRWRTLELGTEGNRMSRQTDPEATLPVDADRRGHRIEVDIADTVGVD